MRNTRRHSAAFSSGKGEANAPATQALLEYAVLFLKILDHFQLLAVDPPGEYHEQQLKRPERRGHCSGVCRLTDRASSSSRLAHSPIALFEFLDTTGKLRCNAIREKRSATERSDKLLGFAVADKGHA